MIKIKKKGDFIIVLLCLCVIGINNISLSKYDNFIKINGNYKIAQAIIEIEKDDKIEENITENSFPIEYNFSINNYKNENINDVEFDYFIEISCSNNNFPISYKLYDLTTGEEIKLIDGKSQILNLARSIKKSRKFKLVLEWKEISEELSDEIKINLKINAIQSRKDDANEN